MRRLHPARWSWSDNLDLATSRYVHFARSGEALTSMLLLAYAIIMLLPNSTFTRSPAFAWLLGLLLRQGLVWAAVATALAITGPVALWFDSGLLRIMSMASQGLFFALSAYSVFRGAPPSFLLATLVIVGAWLLVRASFLLRHHLHSGGRRDVQRLGG